MSGFVNVHCANCRKFEKGDGNLEDFVACQENFISWDWDLRPWTLPASVFAPRKAKEGSKVNPKLDPEVVWIRESAAKLVNVCPFYVARHAAPAAEKVVDEFAQVDVPGSMAEASVSGAESLVGELP